VTAPSLPEWRRGKKVVAYAEGVPQHDEKELSCGMREVKIQRGSGGNQLGSRAGGSNPSEELYNKEEGFF